MYRIDNNGNLETFEKSRFSDNLKSAVLDRIADLESLISSDSMLEIDYDDENEKWNAMRYVPAYQAAFPLEDNNGNFITAFRNIDHNIIEDALSDADVYYVA